MATLLHLIMPASGKSVTECVDVVPSGMTSHLIVGPYASVMERAGQIRARYGTARMIACHGNGAHDHAECVIHRPTPSACRAGCDCIVCTQS